MKPCNNHKFGRIHLHFQSFLFNVLFNRENKPTAAKRSIFLTFIPKQFKMKQFLSFFVMLTLQSPFRQDCLAYLESFAFEPGLNLTECLFVYLCIKFIHDQPIQSLQNNEDSFIDFSNPALWVCYVTLLMASWMVHLSAIALRKTLRASSRISSGRSDSTSEIVFLDFLSTLIENSPWSSPWILALAASCLNVKVLMFINEYLKIIVREVIDWNQPQKRGCCRHLWWLSKSRAFSIPWSARKQSSSSSWWQRSSIWQQATLRTKIFVFLWNKWFFAISFASYLLSANGPMQNACTLVSKFCFRLNKLGPIIKYQISNTIEYILVPTCSVESKIEKN